MSATATKRMATSDSGGARPDPVVQYVVVRGDLVREPHSWPTGSVVAQAVHASLAAVWAFKDNETTRQYCDQQGGVACKGASQSKDGDSDAGGQMHTVVLEAKNETAVSSLAENLDEAGIDFALWTEQPENFVTALATRPYRRSDVQQYFKKFRLFK